MPWVFFLCFLPEFHAPEKVEEEDELRSNGNESGDTDENVDRLQLCEVSHGSRVKIAPRMARQPQEMHWHKDGIDTYERQPEVNLPNPFVQEPAKHLRKPEICGREHSENRRHAHDQVKVRDNEVGVVKIQVQCRLGQK